MNKITLKDWATQQYISFISAYKLYKANKLSTIKSEQGTIYVILDNYSNEDSFVNLITKQLAPKFQTDPYVIEHLKDLYLYISDQEFSSSKQETTELKEQLKHLFDDKDYDTFQKISAQLKEAGKNTVEQHYNGIKEKQQQVVDLLHNKKLNFKRAEIDETNVDKSIMHDIYSKLMSKNLIETEFKQLCAQFDDLKQKATSAKDKAIIPIIEFIIKNKI